MAYFKYTLFYLKTLTWVKANIHMGQSAKPGFWFEPATGQYMDRTEYSWAITCNSYSENDTEKFSTYQTNISSLIHLTH